MQRKKIAAKIIRDNIELAIEIKICRPSGKIAPNYPEVGEVAQNKKINGTKTSKRDELGHA